MRDMVLIEEEVDEPEISTRLIFVNLDAVYFVLQVMVNCYPHHSK